jgi:hypothetical protein
VCVGRCQTSAECSAGRICGRYDFRGVVPDAGGPDGALVREGPDFEVLRACRPRVTVACDRDEVCPAGFGCLGVPAGVCARRCARSGECGATALCFAAPLRAACGEPGLCAPSCDDGIECPAGWYCQTAFGGASVQGRCHPREPIDGGCGPVDAAIAGDAARDAAASDAGGEALGDGALGDGPSRGDSDDGSAQDVSEDGDR